MVLVLTGLVPHLEEGNKSECKYTLSTTQRVADSPRLARPELSEEAVALLINALSALVDASEVFPSVIKTDLHACVFHILATILATPSCQAAVVPQSLPILKRFVTSIASHSNSRSDSSTQVRATLTRFLAILKRAQQRDFDSALACEKNAILASTLLVSSTTSLLDAADPLLSRFVSTLFDCLGSRLTSKVAAGCCRSLLLLPKKGPVETGLAAKILPLVLSFLANPEDVEGLDESRSLLASALVAFISTLSTAEQRAVAAKIVVPALLARVEKEPQCKSETAARILELAGKDQVAFKGVVAGLTPGMRSVMEEVLKSGAGKRRERMESEEREEPTIALKMNFGG
jgi:hypothetical protein